MPQNCTPSPSQPPSSPHAALLPPPPQACLQAEHSMALSARSSPAPHTRNCDTSVPLTVPAAACLGEGPKTRSRASSVELLAGSCVGFCLWGEPAASPFLPGVQGSSWVTVLTCVLTLWLPLCVQCLSPGEGSTAPPIPSLGSQGKSRGGEVGWVIPGVSSCKGK